MPEIDELLALIKRRRSMRKFKPDPIPDEYVEKMIEAARWSPSGANAQPWEFIIIKEPKTKIRMAELYQEIRSEHYYLEQIRIKELIHPQMRTPQKELPGFKDAPVVIVVCGDRRTLQASALAGRFIGDGGSLDGTYQKNIANAIYGIHLAAAALGLGAQWLTVNDEYEELLKPLLNVPPIILIHAIVPVGYPAYQPPPPYRRDADEMVHYEKYDMSRYRTGDKVVEFIRQLREQSAEAYNKERPVKLAK